APPELHAAGFGRAARPGARPAPPFTVEGMPVHPFRRPRSALLLAVLGILAAAGLALSACKGDDEAGSGSQTAAVLAAVTFLDAAGYHGIDEAINNEKTVPATARSVALKGQAVVKSTGWPAELEPQANALAGILGELAAALEGESPDLAKAGAAAAKAHDAQHEFSDAAWAWLFEQAGIAPPGGHGH
uniref:hypothetical protein n=1 Tax=Tepidiforma sp. TaxID=2682230 RepID=UPI002ADD80F2